MSYMADMEEALKQLEGTSPISSLRAALHAALHAEAAELHAEKETERALRILKELKLSIDVDSV